MPDRPVIFFRFCRGRAPDLVGSPAIVGQASACLLADGKKQLGRVNPRTPSFIYIEVFAIEVLARPRF